MYKYLRVKKSIPKFAPDPQSLSFKQLIGDASIPVSIRAINNLPKNSKVRLYRSLIPVDILTRFDINPKTWKDGEGNIKVKLIAEEGTGVIKILAWLGEDPNDHFYYIEIADNLNNGIDLNFIIINNPTDAKFETDIDAEGNPTYFGTVTRNLPEEEKAMQAGLSPGQIRSGIGGAKKVMIHLEAFLNILAHHAIFLEPLTYTSAWLFERHGFAYVSGHKLMDDIHKEFQPGRALYNALDNSSPFRKKVQADTVRGRAWAIHDGILDVIDKKWDNLRMVKQVGRDAGVNTFSDLKF